MRPPRATHLILSIALLSLVASRAQAQAPEHAEFNAVVIEANELYRAESFAEAAGKYLYAYTVRPEPMLLFNAAQCFRKLDRKQDALMYYRRFLKVPAPDPLPRDLNSARKVATEWIEALSKEPAQPVDQLVDNRSQPDPGPAEPVTKAAEPPASERAPVTPTAAGPGAWSASNQASTRSRSGLRTGAWLSFGVAGAALLGTGLFAVQAVGAESDKNDDPSQQNADRVRRYEVLTNVTGIIAIAAAASGVTLYLLSRPGRAERPPLAIVPTRGGFATSMAWSF